MSEKIAALIEEVKGLPLPLLLPLPLRALPRLLRKRPSSTSC